jgi:hypothetical protein
MEPKRGRPSVWKAHSGRLGCSLPIKGSSSHHLRLGFCFVVSLATTTSLWARVSIIPPVCLIQDPNSWFWFAFVSSIRELFACSSCSCLARQEHPNRDGVPIAKAQPLWCCSRIANIESTQNRVYPHSPKDQGHPLVISYPSLCLSRIIKLSLPLLITHLTHHTNNLASTKVV